MKTFIFIFFIAVLASSCTAYRAARQQKKVDKLFSKVVLNEQAVDRIGAYYNAIHPIEQKPVYIKGKDSIVEVPYPVDVIRDSLIKEACPSINLDSLKVQLTTHIYHYSVDTLRVADSTCIPKLNALQLNYSNLSGKYEEIKKQDIDHSKKADIRLYIIIGLSILSFVQGILFVVQIFKK